MAEQSPQRPVVLIVEDEPWQRLNLLDVVEDAGFDAVEAMDADDAVSILEGRNDVCVVLADIDMPGGFDGLILAARIRDRWPSVELIVTSGKRRPRPEDLPLRAVFFSKPYQPKLIVETLRKLAPVAAGSSAAPEG